MYKTQGQRPFFRPKTFYEVRDFERMNISEMLHCLNSSITADNANSEMSVLERQRSRLKWQQHPPVAYFDENDQLGGAFIGDNNGLCELLANGAMKPDPGFEYGDFQRLFSYGNGPPSDVAGLISSATTGREVSKKRKADKTHNLKVVAEEKKMKGSGEEESKITQQNSNNKSSTTTTAASTAKITKKEKVSEAPKTDYIHVRARRGQATDSHSLAERVRREKISERMKYLQDLVPGCNKITGKAGMLDEIINYVQSLQRQVEFLSMKLAAINPRVDFDVENYLIKEMFPASVPTLGASSSDMANQFNLQFNTLGQGVSTSNLEMVANPMDMALRRATSPPVNCPQPFLDSSTFNPIQQVTWEDELQNLYSMKYQQGRSTSFITQPFTGFQEQGHVKLEM